MIRIGRYRIELPGESYVFEGDDTTVGEALMIETEYGKPYGQWVQALAAEDVPAYQVLVWFLRHKAGRPMARIDVDFPVRQLDVQVIPDSVEDDGSDADPELSAGSGPSSPTSSHGEASEPSEPATASPSSTGTASVPSSGTD